MLWFIVWTLLVVLALLVLGRLAWRVFRQGVALAQELGEAAQRMSAIADQVERIGEQHRQITELAVFADPQVLRRERDRRDRQRRRRRAKAARRRVRAA